MALAAIALLFALLLLLRLFVFAHGAGRHIHRSAGTTLSPAQSATP
jgi:hypothetical protein